MLFNSYFFIFVFFPLCLTGYFLLGRKKRYTLAQIFLLGMSLWFYGYINPIYLLLICGSIGVNYLFILAMFRTKKPTQKLLEMSAAIILNLGALFYFKYFNFFLHNLNRIFATDFTLRTILLPLGISFFTFQQIAYLVDSYRGEVPHYGFLEYASFVAFFPHLSAGPIALHHELIPQFLDHSKKHFNWDNFAKGLFLFVLGLSKKILIADTFGTAVNWGFANVQELDTTNALFVILGYSIQIYFDFSGYSDMAIGLARMLNIDLPVNFDSPYLALTVTDFWKRWHKTLTRFLTKYVYFPLGGSRKGVLRTYLNIMMVFLVSGVWHGANYTFILWGILHGSFQILTRHFKKFFQNMHPALSWMITFVFLNVTFALFRADSIGDTLVLFRRLLSMEFGLVNENIVNAFYLPEIELLCENLPVLSFFCNNPARVLPLAYGASMVLILGTKNAYHHAENFKPGFLNLLCISLLLAWCIMSFSSVSTFLYFNF